MISEMEFEVLINSPKKIVGDIVWASSTDHPSYAEFLVQVENEQGYALRLRGFYGRPARALTFALLLEGSGRIYALDMGKDHKNPDQKMTGPKHKHRWRGPRIRDKEAYVPEDITLPLTNPVGLWQQFCEEAKISHVGTMSPPPMYQPKLVIL